MARSMTGFGRAETEKDGRRISVEIRAVNHRYLDLNIRLPRTLAPFEGKLRSLLKEYMERGKTDVYVSFEDLSEKGVNVTYNKALAGKYLSYMKEMSKDFSLEEDIRVSTLARFPDVLVASQDEEDEDMLWSMLEETARLASANFVECREKEGANLKADLDAKLDDMLEKVEVIEKRSPEILKAYEERLRAKIEELLKDSSALADEGRIITEVGIYADKICTDEEVVRLKSHIRAVKAELDKKEAVGRKLDFLAQEMNREANTTLSKANDLELSNTAIGLKNDIEKIREQIQNIE
ncbi:MAG: YicC family protein [Lachnospiraceae bacterium]|nr:YicC family protein [Lachnospiraceae bacterium]